MFAFEVKRPGGKANTDQAGQLMLWKMAGATVAVVHGVDDVRKLLDVVPF